MRAVSLVSTSADKGDKAGCMRTVLTHRRAGRRVLAGGGEIGLIGCLHRLLFLLAINF